MMSSNEAIRFRMKIILLLVPIAIALGVRLYYIQVKYHDEYFAKARERYTTTKITNGKRGEIYDNKGHLLVGNIPCVNITADPAHLKDDQQRRMMSAILEHFLHGRRDDYSYALRPTRTKVDKDGNPLLGDDGRPIVYQARYAMLARNVDIETAATLKETLKKYKLPSLFFEESYMRTYPKGRLLSNVLGFTNIVQDNVVPQIGLERQLNEQMTAETGRESYERTRDGMPLSYGLHESQESRDGKNIYLTISEPIQAILEEELDAAYEKWRPETLYAAIADPKTGNILAIAQRPTFDPNDRSTFTAESARTRIAEDSLEPGSIAKPFTIGKALDWGYVTPQTEIDCEKGAWVYLRKVLRDSHPYDMLTVTGVIQKSSNVGTAKVAMLMGEERVYAALHLFGFGTKTGLPFPLENRGLLPPVPKWDGLSITRFPIGYGIRVTPLQMLRAYCALANHGRLPQLRLIDRIEDPVTGEIRTLPIEPPVQMFDHPEAHRQLIEMMTLVTKPGGTAVRAAIPGYEVAGKTGTSRKYIVNQGYATGKYFSSFVGFVPAYDPALVMIVTMDEAKGAYYAGTVAAPTFQSTASRVLRYLNIDPDPELMTERERKELLNSR